MPELLGVAAVAGLFAIFGVLLRGAAGCPGDCGCAAGTCRRRDGEPGRAARGSTAHGSVGGVSAGAGERGRRPAGRTGGRGQG